MLFIAPAIICQAVPESERHPSLSQQGQIKQKTANGVRLMELEILGRRVAAEAALPHF